MTTKSSSTPTSEPTVLETSENATLLQLITELSRRAMAVNGVGVVDEVSERFWFVEGRVLKVIDALVS